MPAYNLKARVGKLQELEARGVIKPEHQAELDSYRSQGMSTGNAPGGRVKTTPDDMKVMNDASQKAATERDALRTYAGASKAVDNFGPWGTGPVTATFLDAITPEEDGGVLDKVGAFLGTPFRAMTSQRTMDARDHLKTVNANVALAGSQQMKGSSSDKDTALMRLSGIGPSKSGNENKRIIRQAIYDSGLSQARSLITSHWIGKYGSLSNPDANGRTFEQALQQTENNYAERRRRRTLPKAPPSKRGGGTLTIDLDGNPIR